MNLIELRQWALQTAMSMPEKNNESVDTVIERAEKVMRWVNTGQKQPNGPTPRGNEGDK